MSKSQKKKNLSFGCHKICGGYAKGEALVSSDKICFYLTKPQSSEIIEKNHSLKDKKIAHKILIFPGGKGSSVVQGEGLYMLRKYDNAPAAMIIESPDTVLVSGAIIMKIPLVDRVDPLFYKRVSDGDNLIVDADKELITIIKN